MATTTTKPAFKLLDYKSEIHNDWCPGCGDFGILTALQMALAKLQIPPHRVAVVSGIGCSGKTPHYMETYAFHTLHGRAMPSVTGLKLANLTQKVNDLLTITKLYTVFEIHNDEQAAVSSFGQ